MIDELTDIRRWRAKEIAKLFLLKSVHRVSFTERGLFDLVVLVGDNPVVELGLFVLLSSASDEDIEEQIDSIQTKETISYNLPVLLMLIDEVKESGKLSFVVEPNGQHLVPVSVHLHPLNPKSLSNCLQKVVLWGSSQSRKIA